MKSKVIAVALVLVFCAGAAVVDAAFTAIDFTEQASAPALSASGHARMYAKTDHTLLVSQNGGAYAAIGGGSTASVDMLTSNATSTSATLANLLHVTGLVPGNYSCTLTVPAGTDVLTDGGGFTLGDDGTGTWSVAASFLRIEQLGNESFATPKIIDSDTEPFGIGGAQPANVTTTEGSAATASPWQVTGTFTGTVTSTSGVLLKYAQAVHTTGTLTVGLGAALVCNKL